MRVTFEIGDLFDANDPISRFIAGLCMVTNDLMLATEKTGEEYERGKEAREGVSISYMYDMCSHYREAAKFLHAALSDDAVLEFVAQLPEDAQANLDLLTKSFTPWEGSFVQTRLKPARDDTSHYPQFGSERLSKAMKEASGLRSCIDLGDGSYQGTRYEFADEILTQIMHRHFGTDQATIRDAFERVGSLVVALTHFTHSAVTWFLRQAEEGAFDLDGPGQPAGGDLV